MTLQTKFSPGDRVAAVAKSGGTWLSGPGTVISITVVIPGDTTYNILRDTGGNINRPEALVFGSLAEADAMAGVLNT